MIPLLALNGPTASGKSSLSVEVAVLLRSHGIPAEVVNADSMLVYEGMDIGTAKPTPRERQGVPHHLIDIWPVTRSATVADFQGLARDVIAEVRDRGVVPILVGGSALYMRAIVDQFDFPGTDPAVRARWEAELDQIGAPALHRLLAARSPEAAAELNPGNGRRIVRALEVLDLTGDHRPTLPEWTFALEGVLTHGLSVERAEMDARIDARVAAMWEQGLVDEVRRLEGVGLRSGRTASKALGYRQVLDYLAGNLTEEQARLATAAGTRRFARKQLGWFRRDHRITWHEAGDPGAAHRVADDVIAAWRANVGE
ncbi:tRNA (adenosine(37)-N6)-dimethylallyltransferase MiaA [Propioniciclava flava]|uniref:tRNA (adenosine(37)-N6)-dimethylallyltransferase MiaA n=1 Tax=Propioniciclava flava TaxID=2072026 RepID=UPI0019D64C51|nr:tRNA (adenosine(37)-N6)-dimethylallyltransferase MiaA [Propioniciclava flava]